MMRVLSKMKPEWPALVDINGFHCFPYHSLIIFVKTFCILIVAKAYVAALFPRSFYLVQYMPKLTLSWFSILMDHGANIIPHKHSCCVKAVLGVSSSFFVSYGDDRIVSVVIQAVRLTCLPLHCRFVLMFCGDLFVCFLNMLFSAVWYLCVYFPRGVLWLWLLVLTPHWSFCYQ